MKRSSFILSVAASLLAFFGAERSSEAAATLDVRSLNGRYAGAAFVPTSSAPGGAALLVVVTANGAGSATIKIERAQGLQSIEISAIYSVSPDGRIHITAGHTDIVGQFVNRAKDFAFSLWITEFYSVEAAGIAYGE